MSCKKLYRVTIKKGKKTLAKYNFVGEFGDDAVEEAIKIFFGGNPPSDEAEEYSYITQCLGVVQI